jgi:hypothetical protein
MKIQTDKTWNDGVIHTFGAKALIDMKSKWIYKRKLHEMDFWKQYREPYQISFHYSNAIHAKCLKAKSLLQGETCYVAVERPAHRDFLFERSPVQLSSRRPATLEAFSWSTSFLPCKCRESIVNYATTASFHVLSNSSINQTIFRRMMEEAGKSDNASDLYSEALAILSEDFFRVLSN